MVKVDFLPKQYQILMKAEDFLELILGLDQYVKEFPDGTWRLQEILDVFKAKYVGDLPQTEEEVERTRDQGNMGGTPSTETDDEEGQPI